MCEWVRVEFNSVDPVLIGEAAHEREWVIDVRNIAEGTFGSVTVNGENGGAQSVSLDSGDASRISVRGKLLTIAPDFRGQVAEYAHA